jgi:putative acetyltransferase
MMHIAFETPNQPEVISLIADLDAYQLTLYPPELVYALDLPSLMEPHVKFAVAREGGASGKIVGCCAIVLSPEYGEIKRLYVDPAGRGKGTGRGLLSLLEKAALEAGCAQMVLETGPSQPEAMGLYERHGFQRCGAFGDYPDEPMSVFMRKGLRPASALETTA